MEFLGSTFIKLGQWASTRRDLFSEDLCDTLAHLQRQSSEHSWMYTEFLMSATFGPEWEKLFRRFDRKPIGSGCCAQVHKAWIKRKKLQLYQATDNSHPPFYLHGSRFPTKKVIPVIENSEDDELVPVVVKVVHPCVENYVETDLFMIELLSVLTSFLVPSLRWLDLPGCAKEFSTMMLNQLDMKMEAHNLQRFSSNFSKNHSVIFPTPLRNLTTRRILVESYHEGKHISEYLNLSDHNDLKKQLVKIAIPLVMKMVFEDNFFHCDLHPGNILVQEEDVLRRINKTQLYQRIFSFRSRKAPRLVILDCGLVSSLSNRCLQNLRDVFHSIVTGDGALAGEYLMRHSSHMTPDPSGFKTAIESIVNRHMTNKFSLQNVNLTAVMREFYSALIHYKVQQDSAFINVVLSVLLIEGLGRNLDATSDILQELIPFLR
ncbi:uncharacterized aarF domain-containing protein kinase 2-like [Diachasma alloeum]|uniref:uncharacterized aarF domain-containing protein kinase 2-like n=1 Tax=Diachasma alloeum TaxID=454923 RepID=UPI0007384459|nr:uncharacterized aarF domain-containing protein kinase 2-like [Diachasma alloeum]